MHKTRKIPIYPGRLHIFDNALAAVDWMEKKCGERFEDSLGSDGFAWEYRGDVVVCVTDAKIITAHHESIHAAWGLLDYAGVEIDRRNHEALTYLSDWIFEECMKWLELK